MKKTIIDEEGDVRCPKCGARNSFTVKRTGKAKVMGGLAVGVGALAAPKRLQCQGCGTYLKQGAPARSSARPAKPEKLSTRVDRAHSALDLKHQLDDDPTPSAEERYALLVEAGYRPKQAEKAVAEQVKRYGSQGSAPSSTTPRSVDQRADALDDVDDVAEMQRRLDQINEIGRDPSLSLDDRVRALADLGMAPDRARTTAAEQIRRLIS